MPSIVESLDGRHLVDFAYDQSAQSSMIDGRGVEDNEYQGSLPSILRSIDTREPEDIGHLGVQSSTSSNLENLSGKWLENVSSPGTVPSPPKADEAQTNVQSKESSSTSSPLTFVHELLSS